MSNQHTDAGDYIAQITAPLSSASRLMGTKGDIFKALNAQIPLNDMGLPEYIYRADLIPANLGQMEPRHRSDMLEAASIPLTFEHGFPALNETQPFWEQLIGETADAFTAFMMFLEMPEKSAHDNPVRILPMIAVSINIPTSTLTEWAHMYYWHFRARAYDMFIIACHRKQREQRIMSIEGKHFKAAENYLAKIDLILGAKLDTTLQEIASSESTDDTKLKDLVDMVDKLVKIQRISVGLPANGSTTLSLLDGPRNSSAVESMRHVAAEAQGEQKQTQRSVEMDALLQNPEDLEAIQNLIIRVSQQGN